MEKIIWNLDCGNGTEVGIMSPKQFVLSIYPKSFARPWLYGRPAFLIVNIDPKIILGVSKNSEKTAWRRAAQRIKENVIKQLER